MRSVAFLACSLLSVADAHEKNIVELAESVKDLSTLVSAVVAADLADTLSSPGPFTVFAPTNAAFGALPSGTLDDLMKPENKEQLSDILTYHVASGKLLAKDLDPSKPVTTVEGKSLYIQKQGDSVQVGPLGDLKTVTAADNLASNGAVHIIDGVLLPPTEPSRGAVRAALAGTWNRLSKGPWHSSEGLMVASVGDKMVLTGGRTHSGTVFQGGEDSYTSEDGIKWTHAPESAWAKRAYHILLGPDQAGCLFLMGGQTFSKFYNDVWKSCDAGESWEEVLEEAPWPGRAGLAGTMHNGKMYIAGGCFDKVDYDPGFFREFYDDVWSSSDGKNWELVAEHAGWQARSGGRLVSFKGKLFMVAGEIGFTPETQLVDVWSSSDDGKTWELVTANPAYSARSGHGLVTYGDYMILIAGWPQLSDIYYSQDGAEWVKSPGLAWNCNSTKCGKYDFWPLIHKNKLFLLGGSGTTSTFGKLYKETWSLDLPPLTNDMVLI